MTTVQGASVSTSGDLPRKATRKTKAAGKGSNPEQTRTSSASALKGDIKNSPEYQLILKTLV